MASTATTLLATAAQENYPALSLRGVLECWLVAIQSVPANSNTLLATAAAQDYPALSDRELMECILAALAGGGGTGGIASGNYGGVAPTFTPTSGSAIAIDSTNGKIWAYYNSTWTFTGVTA